MRPLLVLGLVLAAIAALLFSLNTILSDSEPQGGPDDDQPALAVEEGPVAKAPEDLVQPETYEAPEVVESGPGRDVVVATGNDIAAPTQPTGSWDNELTGIVRDDEGLPVGGVTLVVQRMPLTEAMAAFQALARRDTGAAPQAEPVYGTSMEDGTFSFRRLPPAADYRIVAKDKEDRFARYTSDTIEIGVEGKTTYDITLNPGLVLHGHVTDVAGSPVSGARLKLVNGLDVWALTSMQHSPALQDAGSDQLGAKSDDQGYYRFSNVVPGTRTLIVKAEGYGAQELRNITFNEAKEVVLKDIVLDFGHTIAGTVVGPDRAGVEGARVEAIGRQGGVTNSRGIAISDENGRFEISDLVEGSYTVLARKEGYSNRSEHAVVDAPDGNVLIELATLGGVVGRVVVSASNEPINEQFRVSARMVHAGSTMAYGRTASTEFFQNAENGEFELGGLEEGTYVLQVFAPSFAPTFSEPFTVNQGMFTPDVLVRMTTGGVIRGRVVSSRSREPVAGATITTYDNDFIENPITELFGASIPRMTAQATTRTDANGEFLLKNLNPENYQIKIVHPTHTDTYLKGRRVVDGGEDDIGTITMTDGAIIRGTVYDAAGSPLPHAKVQLSGSLVNGNVPRQYDARTGADGRYEIRRVAEGSYRINASRGGNVANTGNPFETILDMKTSEVSLSIADGTEQVQDLNLGGS